MNTIALLIAIGLGFSIILFIGFELVCWFIRTKARPDYSQIKRNQPFLAKIDKEFIVLRCSYNDAENKLLYARNELQEEVIVEYKNVIV